MAHLEFEFYGIRLWATGAGCLVWPDQNLLVVSDLHLGKSDRLNRKGAGFLPPYETQDTLTRLDQEITTYAPKTVICLGDSFDDLEAAGSLLEAEKQWLTTLQAGRNWIWIEGNHDPGPVEFGGTHLAEVTRGPLRFRHIATPQGGGEISGHYHPKAQLKGTARPAFLVDETRIILPAFGTYTGGLHSHDAQLVALMKPDAKAILTGAVPLAIPMPRTHKNRTQKNRAMWRG